jgi:hypothetical protein
MGSMCRSASRCQPASRRSLRPECFSRLRLAAPARPAGTGQSSCTAYPQPGGVASSSRSGEGFKGYSLCAFSKRARATDVFSQRLVTPAIGEYERRHFLSPAQSGSPRAAEKVEWHGGVAHVEWSRAGLRWRLATAQADSTDVAHSTQGRHNCCRLPGPILYRRWRSGPARLRLDAPPLSKPELRGSRAADRYRRVDCDEGPTADRDA